MATSFALLLSGLSFCSHKEIERIIRLGLIDRHITDETIRVEVFVDQKPAIIGCSWWGC
ncbi:hypothetical protein D3C85_860790 [compost metagenome]